MLEEVKKGFLAGIGVVVLTREKIEIVCQKLVKEAKMSKEDAQKLADELSRAGEKQWTDLEKTISESFRSVMDSLHIGSSEDLEHLKLKLDNMEKRLSLLESIVQAEREKLKSRQEKGYSAV
jgi:polyhydroxyalkanoate synthesis regulator phasin